MAHTTQPTEPEVEVSFESVHRAALSLIRAPEVILRRGLIRPFIGSLIAVALIGVAVWLGTLENLKPQAALIVCVPLAGFGVLLLGTAFLRVCDTSRKLRLHSEGLTDYQSRRLKRVRWEDIVNARYLEQSRDGLRQFAVVILTVSECGSRREVEINVDGLSWSAEAVYREICLRADLW